MKSREELYIETLSYLGRMKMKILNMTIITGYTFFEAINKVKREDTLWDAGIEYKARLRYIVSGAHTGGDSHGITDTLNLLLGDVGGEKYYSYLNAEPYVESFMLSEDKPQTQEQTFEGSGYYSGVNDMYKSTTNLYYDDNDGLNTTDANLRTSNSGSNKNSIVTKTKQLFEDRKINTIISRFHTENPGIENGDEGSRFGLSHGRNLLKRNAERNGISESPNDNSYDNPYCRVWTHHYQYDRLDKLIRPFVVDGEPVSLAAMHTWTDEFKKTWGWKNNNERWNRSVLNENGHVNITPKKNEGGASSLHTKQCMFSIENLAWKGMSPFEFEKNLSWEQRGPMGGRIMWFPPYGINFNETTVAQWNNHTFIGRGEDVYTYVNTKRSGTLNFMMVVDHPSVTDYSTWYRTPGDNQPGGSDTDLLRFFAGCDTGDAEDNGGEFGSDHSFFSQTKPPLYDTHEADAPNPKVEKPAVPDKPTEPEIAPLVEEVKPIQFTFYVFYPNNYSGVYDLPNSNVDSSVDFAAYLVNGVGTQKRYKDEKGYNYGDGGTDSNLSADYILKYSEDVPIDYNTYGNLQKNNGYEIYIKNGGIGYVGDGKVGNEYALIHGTMNTWTSYGNNLPSRYPFTTKEIKHYYYRPDGMYEVPSSTNDPDRYLNTYDDILQARNYKDTASFGYNSTYGYEKVAEKYNENTDVESENCLYAFTDVVAALYYDINGRSLVKAGIADESRVAKLVDILKNYEILSVSGFGSASTDANSSAAAINQMNLCMNRYKSIQSWLRSAPSSPFTSSTIEWNKYEQDSVSTDKNVSGDVSSSVAKLSRYAKVVIKVKSNASKSVAETEQTTDVVTVVDDTSDIKGQNVTSVTDGNGDVKLATVEKKQNTVQKSVLYQYSESDFLNHKVPQQLYEDYMRVKYNGGKGVVLDHTQVMAALTGSSIGNYDENIGFVDTINSSAVTASSKLDGNSILKAGRATVMNPSGLAPRSNWNVENVDVQSTKRNYIRYDQEFNFFKELKVSDPAVFGRLMDKLQYFDPAFHSMTPEGFNGRLAFLHQCTRQGNTVSASSQSGQATNLSFGRPPVCVLRLGDFYNQMIIINSINMTYDVDGGVQWDLNPEGNGVQPLIANITISFDFVGGGDLYGPIRRLQNAMTFNYYANQGLYDNRADWEEREWDHEHADTHAGKSSSQYDNIKNSYHYLPQPDGNREGLNFSGENAELKKE